MIQGSLGDAISHSLRFQGGHTLYVVLMWFIETVTGLSELGLRFPSLLGMVGTCYLSYRLGRRVYDQWVGLFAAVFLAFLPAIAFAATDARPYALAMMMLVGSTLALINWLDSASTRNALIYAASTAAVAYLHYMFILPLLAHLVYLLFRIRSGQRIEWRTLVPGAAFLAAFLLPTVPNLLRVMREAGVLSNPYLTEAHQVVEYLLPTTLMRVLVPVTLVACLLSAPRLRSRPYVAGSLPLLVAWIAIPVGILYLSSLRGTNVFVPRYFVMLLPAISLLGALGLRQLAHVEAQVGIMVIAGLVVVGSLPTPTHTLENWRAAAAVVRDAVTDPETPVLMFSGLIEGNQISFLTDPERASYLNAPAAMYPMEGRLIPVPFTIAGETETFMQQVVGEDLMGAETFIFVSRGEIHKAWLDSATSSTFVSTQLASFDGSVTVFRYSRTG